MLYVFIYTICLFKQAGQYNILGVTDLSITFLSAMNNLYIILMLLKENRTEDAQWVIRNRK